MQRHAAPAPGKQLYVRHFLSRGCNKGCEARPINWPKGALLISKRVLSIMYITLHGCQLRDIFGHKLGKMRISCSPVGTSPQLLENF